MNKKVCLLSHSAQHCARCCLSCVIWLGKEKLYRLKREKLICSQIMYIENLKESTKEKAARIKI